MKYARKLICLMIVLVTIMSFAIPTMAAENKLMYGIGFVNTEGLRLRSSATTASTALDTASKNDCVVVVAKEGDWYKVVYNLQEGYMYSSYLNVLARENAELGYGEVTGSSVNLRRGAGTAYGVIDIAHKGEKCYIIGINDGWYKVLFEGNTCYIRSDYLKLTEIPYENKDSSNSPKYFRGGKAIASLPSSGASTDSGSGNSSVSFTGSQIVAKAQQYLGTPYVYGGASPSGFDCSGFTYYVLKSFGYNAYRTPADQYSHGTYVSKSELKDGDLVFFSSTGGASITHVGIYVGNGQFIHSPNSRSVVSYADLTSGYWSNTYYGARRVA